MGAARSVLRRATSIKGSTRERFLLTEEEVEEDAACLEAQRRSIKYCVDNLYYGAPVQLSGVRTPKHHLPSALVSFARNSGAPVPGVRTRISMPVAFTKRQHKAVAARSASSRREKPW